MPRTRGWTLGEIIMIAIAFVAIAVALVLIVYAIEVHLPERHGWSEQSERHSSVYVGQNSPGWVAGLFLLPSRCASVL